MMKDCSIEAVLFKIFVFFLFVVLLEESSRPNNQDIEYNVTSIKYENYFRNNQSKEKKN